ncbi:hypothetical protein EST38_g10617 [Candolleomyces aberdarensis]|uniref:Uncharacterized protein n=1 Tax=Candolleomyces aberdarensis TaxID=2316362 RepID=A0A4Q2D6X9_9AGAR|nr:hypothetical protein EST38_g10617 [Candolleomyces aberdarensis]
MEFEMSFKEVREVDEDESDFVKGKDAVFLGGIPEPDDQHAIDTLSPLNSLPSSLFGPLPLSQLCSGTQPVLDFDGGVPAALPLIKPFYADFDNLNNDFVLDGSTILAALDLPVKPKGDVQTSHSNSKVTAMMALQCAKDAWLQATQTGFHAELTQDDLKDFLSPSISRQLALHNDTITGKDGSFEFNSNCNQAAAIG